MPSSVSNHPNILLYILYIHVSQSECILYIILYFKLRIEYYTWAVSVTFTFILFITPWFNLFHWYRVIKVSSTSDVCNNQAMNIMFFIFLQYTLYKKVKYLYTTTMKMCMHTCTHTHTYTHTPFPIFPTGK